MTEPTLTNTHVIDRQGTQRYHHYTTPKDGKEVGNKGGLLHRSDRKIVAGFVETPRSTTELHTTQTQKKQVVMAIKLRPFLDHSYLDVEGHPEGFERTLLD